ncbi:MAG: glycoside hydrolase [Planctomycetota bacterium]|nr:glycoside hydrolase [Planctomycetota bacterium]
MPIQKFRVAHDPELYHAWPDVALTPSGKLVCVFSECTHHGDRSYTRFMLTESADRGRSWSPKRPLSEPLRCDAKAGPYWNCARIVALADGRLCAVGDRIRGRSEGNQGGLAAEQSNWLWFSADEGAHWDGPHPTPVHGIVPDQLVELKRGGREGQWVLSAHTVQMDGESEKRWHERAWISADRGASWDGPHTVASVPGLKLCEGSVFELPGASWLACSARTAARGSTPTRPSAPTAGGPGARPCASRSPAATARSRGCFSPGAS